MSAWQGDISELGNLANVLGRLASVPSQASASAAKGIAEAIDQQFESECDPYGRPWTPLEESTIERKGHNEILQETERLRNGIHVTPRAGAGIDVTIDAEYAGFHQTGFRVGSKQVPARPVLPYAEVPDTWERAISDALEEAFERAFG